MVKQFKIMRYRIYTIILFLIIIGNFFCATHNGKPEKNYENLKKVKISMKMDTVIKIMGQPDTIIIDRFGNPKYYYGFMYKSQFGMSDNFYIYISQKDSLVVGINDGN